MNKQQEHKEQKTSNIQCLKTVDVMNNLYSIYVQIKQKCFTAPFDTGCQEIIINENAYKMLGKPQLKNSNFYLNAWNLKWF